MNPEGRPGDEIGIRGHGPWIVPPEVFQEVLDGAVTQRDFVVYAAVGHLIWCDYQFTGWSEVAKLLKMSTPKLLAALDRLTAAGWLFWKNQADYEGCTLSVSKRARMSA